MEVFVPDASAPVWQVPINISTSADPSAAAHKLLLRGKEAEFRLEGVGEAEWVKLNAGQTGYYRVEYSAGMLKKLVAALNERKLEPVDRFNLITDLWALVGSIRNSTSFLHFLTEHTIYVCKRILARNVYSQWWQMDL